MRPLRFSSHSSSLSPSTPLTPSVLVAVPAVFAAALLVTACGDGNNSSSGGTAGTGGTTSSGGTAGTGGTTGGTGGTTGGTGGADPGDSVLQRNKHATRDGLFVQPTLTKAAAAKMHLDAAFKPQIDGNVYSQPLYVQDGPGGKGVFFVATEKGNLHAVAEADGATVWTKNLSPPADNTGAGCGNISPLGITGTPVIDLPGRTLYVSAVIGNAQTIIGHQLHALSIDDGSEKAGYPHDVTGLSAGGQTFKSPLENQRGALTLLNDTVYIPYGGHYGDCGAYHGWLVGVPTANPSAAKGWATPAQGGGTWAPGGVASDGQSLFIATGNTFGASTWSGGEAILRLTQEPNFSGADADYFAPSNWKSLDNADVDIGGSGPLLIDVPGATPSALVVALGKNGVAYLLDRNNLGGIGKGNGTTGEGVASAHVANGEIINVAASYTTASGVYVVLHVYEGNSGDNCPNGSGDLVALKIGASNPPTISVAWCADNHGEGSPIATSTDGKSDVVVWTAGTSGQRKLHGYDGDTGAEVFAGGGDTDVMGGSARGFLSPIAVHGRIIAAGDNGLYSFSSN